MQAGLHGQRFLVTGAGGGIGQAIARHLAADGATVLVHYHTSADAATALARELGNGAVALAADLRDEAQVDGLYDRALADGARLDGVVVNAGVWVERAVPLHEMELRQWRETMESDLTSAFLTCRGFLRHLRRTPREHASIVLIASTAALFGEAGHADYAAAKAAMAHGMTLSLKNEIVQLAPRGRVNCICPGWVRTAMTEQALADEAGVARALQTMPLQKVATVDDVAALVTFLSSATLAGHLSGTVTPVSGGMEGRVVAPR